MAQEALDRGEDPLVTSIAKDPTFLYWMRVLKGSDSLEPDAAVELADSMWRVASKQYGANPELREAVFIKASTMIDEENQAHAHET